MYPILSQLSLKYLTNRSNKYNVKHAIYLNKFSVRITRLEFFKYNTVFRLNSSAIYII